MVVVVGGLGDEKEQQSSFLINVLRVGIGERRNPEAMRWILSNFEV